MFKTVLQKIDKNSLKLSKDIIAAGGVLAFPTETVYGLAADAFNDAAISLIYKIKGRPLDNPLIVHIHKDYDIESIVYDAMPYAKMLRELFLPGALTMVYKSKNTVSPLISKTGTLAIRVPSHSGAQQFLSAVQTPIAAPSANISKHISPVTAHHVLSDLNGKIPLILDGGKSQTGIESTVLDVTGKIPLILRAGSVTRQMIADTVGACEVSGSENFAKSPGTMYSHYMPRAETLYFPLSRVDEAAELYHLSQANGQSACVICDSFSAQKLKALKNVYDLGNSAAEIARNLYTALRDAEDKYSLIIGIELYGSGSDYDGVVNRFTKAFSVYGNV